MAVTHVTLHAMEDKMQSWIMDLVVRKSTLGLGMNIRILSYTKLDEITQPLITHPKTV